MARRTPPPVPASPVQSDLLTAQEAMAFLRVKARSYLTRHKHEIGVVERGHRLYFRLADLQAWNDRHYRAPVAVAEEPPVREPLPFPNRPLSAEEQARRAKKIASAERAIARARGSASR